MVDEKKTAQLGRSVNLDLIRCVAAFSVVGVHSFRGVPFYGVTFAGTSMWFMTVVRTGFMVCVPLFAMLSGYLCIHKTLSKGYYKKLIPLLLTYLLACVPALILHFAWVQAITPKEAVFSILNTAGGAIGYSWYIEMYIGLYLLIPFLNAAYHGLKTKREKQVLVIVMFILTTLPSMLNSHDWSSFGAFFRPGWPETTQPVFPGWWDDMWPLTYYFLGAYIREYDIPLPKKWNAALLLGWLLCVGSFLFYRSHGGTSLYEPSGKWGSFDKFIHSVLLFLLLVHLDLSKVPGWICRILSRISKLSLGIYLCSYTTDMYVYEVLAEYASTPENMRLLAPIGMLASFTLAAVASQMIQWAIELPKICRQASRRKN